MRKTRRERDIMDKRWGTGNEGYRGNYKVNDENKKVDDKRGQNVW